MGVTAGRAAADANAAASPASCPPPTAGASWPTAIAHVPGAGLSEQGADRSRRRRRCRRRPYPARSGLRYIRAPARQRSAPSATPPARPRAARSSCTGTTTTGTRRSASPTRSRRCSTRRRPLRHRPRAVHGPARARSLGIRLSAGRGPVGLWRDAVLPQAALARATRSPKSSVGEDTRFVATARGARVRVLADNRFFVGPRPRGEHQPEAHARCALAAARVRVRARARGPGVARSRAAGCTAAHGARRRARPWWPPLPASATCCARRR